MRLLIKIWNQPNWVKWIVYIGIIYVLYELQSFFAVLLWVLFCILLYYIIFAKNMIQGTTYNEKKID